MATIDTIVQAIVDIVGDVSGIRKAHDYPRDSINQNLQAVTYPTNIRWSWEETFGKRLVVFDVVIDLTCTTPDLHRAVEALVPFCDSIPDALFADEFLDGNVNEWEGITASIFQREDNGQLMLRTTVTNVFVEADV